MAGKWSLGLRLWPTSSQLRRALHLRPQAAALARGGTMSKQDQFILAASLEAAYQMWVRLYLPARDLSCVKACYVFGVAWMGALNWQRRSDHERA